MNALLQTAGQDAPPTGWREDMLLRTAEHAPKRKTECP